MSLEKVQEGSDSLVPLLTDNENCIDIPINEKNVDDIGDESNINESENNRNNNNNENDNDNTAGGPNENTPSYLLYAGIPLLWILARYVMGSSRRMSDHHHHRHDRHWNRGWGHGWGHGWGRGRGWVRDRDYGYGCRSCCHCHCNHHNNHYNDRSWFDRKNSSCNNYRNNFNSYQNPFWWGLQNYWGYGDDYGSCQECNRSGRSYGYW